jgi:hypothetical protein
MDINIAAAKKIATTSEAFFNAVKEFCPAITAGVIAAGPGCNNFGFRINLPDEEAKEVADALAMALMPARWSICENDPMLIDGKFYQA